MVRTRATARLMLIPFLAVVLAWAEIALAGPLVLPDGAAERLALCQEIPEKEWGLSRTDYLELQRRACQVLLDHGHPDPDLHFYLGRLWAVALNPTMAVEHFIVADMAGSVKGTTALAWTHYNAVYGGGVDLSRTLTLYERAAAKGDPVAKVELALIYGAGLETDADYDRAVQLLDSASEQGYAVADYYLGFYNRHPTPGGREEHPELAVAYFRRAAAGGVEEAYLALSALEHPLPESAGEELAYRSLLSDDLVLLRP